MDTVRYWMGTLKDRHVQFYADNFCNSNYYFMFPFRGWILNRLSWHLARIKAGAVLEDNYFKAVHTFLDAAGLKQEAA